MVIAASIAVGLLVGWLLFRIFFDDFADFTQSIGYWLTPDIFLVFSGEWTEGHWAQMKLLAYALFTVGSGVLTYQKLLDYLR